MPGGSNKPSAFDNVELQPDPVANTTGDNNENGNVDNPDNTDPDGGSTQNVNTVLPARVEYSYDYCEDFAGIDVFINAYDEDGNVLWTNEYPKIAVGQYETVTEIGLRDELYYIVINGTLFAFDAYTGNTSWSVDNVGASCCWVFDGDVLYIAGYEGPALVAIDNNGKEIHRYDQFTNKEAQDYFWASDLFFDGMDLIKVYYNSYIPLVVDPKTGEAYPVDLEGCKYEELATRDWELTFYSSSEDLDFTYLADITGECSIEIDDEYNVSFHFSDKDRELSCDYVPCYFLPHDLFEGIDNYFYGSWNLQGKVDEHNTIAMQLSAPDTLNMLWFTTDENGDPAEFYSFEFMDAEILQYHKDKLELNNQGK